MKMLLKYCIAIILLGSIIPLANGQNAPLGPLMSVTEFTVKMGHEMQFREGIKAWKACYIENEGEWTWRLWSRQQGEGTVYVLASDMANWAEMDKTDEKAQNCRMLAMNMINPNVEKATNHMTRLLPENSNTSPTTDEIIMVYSYKLNATNAAKMMEVVKEVEGIRKKAGLAIEGYWYQWQTAGPESPNYHYVLPYKDFAAMDIMQEGVWETVEKNEGAAKKDELRAAFRSSLDNTWSYIYKLDQELSRPTK
jgi:hypothetical protein